MPSIYEVGVPAWIAMAAAVAAWVVFLWLATRLLFRTRERLRCPVTGHEATVEFVRAPDGFKGDVARCSLREDETVVSCEKECLAPART
jgi:hypothetical protein